MPPTKAAVVLVNSVSLAAAAATVTGAAQDISAAYRAIVRLRFTNGATGPTISAQCVVQVSEDTTTGNFMTIFTAFGGTTASAVTEFAVEIPDAAQQLRIVYGSNTGQAVTLRAVLDKVTAI